MANDDIALMAHLMRRAGFGASLDELEARVAKGYEATVEELLYPELHEPVDIYDLFRYHPWAWKIGTVLGFGSTPWLFYMLNTKAPLQEKMALFWHQIFATGVSKVDQYYEIMVMVDLFREKGLGSYKELLVDVAKNPAMLHWLDNIENRNYAVNENWGRELLELFSMGVGNYTEKDVYECSRAFTGWSIKYMLPRFPMGRFEWEFEYNEEFHDNTEKEFLGNVGNFNGEDVIDIICQQPATANFVSRHLYNFFVADEPQVPAWSVTPPRDPEAIETLSKAFVEFGLRHQVRAPHAVQLRLLQERPLLPHQEPHGSGGGDSAAGRWVRVPLPWNRRHVSAVLLHGPGPAQPAQRGGMAHWQGVD